ncbi:pyridine nucleotide-disulfide oxidoreductase [Desulfolithobacter dissulfuricans]|uniref:Pyridine nucleotide-disulfide oxidoreductase n=1 Tax=Desulfolithobacter dissulfuricans TaxID=2795293 RepID=A0A915U1V9_9BACT|nr:FAD-dependent oxidoreductase [Desulfolithobacter dissulfuricans]BCO09669.1 pyridine nucleotide-disulfide oxidoreductase [Desulfolithobacter dissulfuricans]
MSEVKKVLIIGGVAAGPKAACHLKRVKPGWEVTVVDQDSLISYGGCGIPYYVCGDVSDESELRSTSFHMIRDEKFFADAKGVTVLTRTRALSINREEKKVLVENLDTGEQSELPYDKLMLATGARPVVLPVPGTDLDGVFTISDLHKAIEIKKRIARGMVEKAVVIGGGAIGVEMAEALTDLWGVQTSLVEFMPQLLPRIVDWEFAAMLKTHLEEKEVAVYTGEGATELIGNGDGHVVAVKTPERTLEADLVIMAAGVRPRSELAREAGLAVAPWGGIVVNRRLQTTDPDIYAAGDCIATTNLITGKETYAPLGSLANREGRIVGDNMAGIPSTFDGVVGSFIMKAFDRCIAATGLTYEAALAEGFEADYALTAPSDRAHFFPGEAIVVYQMVFDKRTRKVLGLQGFGMMNDSISARIDTAAALISKGATIEDFITVEMAYAPPFSAAVDSINAAAFVADNICAGRLRKVSMRRFLAWMEDFSREPDWAALDIRHPLEATPFVEKFGAERWVAVPYAEVRKRYHEIPDDKTLIILCDAGTRSFEVQVFLDHLGKTNTMVLSGGFNVIRRIGVDWIPQQ